MIARLRLFVLLLVSPLTAMSGSWTGSGELGLAVSRGNSESENLNTKLAVQLEDGAWTHAFGVAALRARSEVSGDFDGDGVDEQRSEVSANRFQVNATSSYRMTPRSSWIAALRHENDDFAAFETQTTLSVGYGYAFVDTEQVKLRTEIGPGYRRAERRDGGTESDMILRGLLDYSHALTATTTLGNTLLVESGSSNTFAQNDFGVSVAMNDRLALKAGLQVRHNSEVEPGTERTDTLTTVNLVYTFD